jgi:hypothetical protein
VSDTITLPRDVGKTIRKALTRRERYLFPTEQAALDALTAALAEPEPEPITEDALREWLDAQDRDLWQRRADEAFLKEYEKRHGKPEPATYEQAQAAHRADCYLEGIYRWHDYRTGWQAAEHFHKIGGSKT